MSKNLTFSLEWLLVVVMLANAGAMIGCVCLMGQTRQTAPNVNIKPQFRDTNDRSIASLEADMRAKGLIDFDQWTEIKRIDGVQRDNTVKINVLMANSEAQTFWLRSLGIGLILQLVGMSIKWALALNKGPQPVDVRKCPMMDHVKSQNVNLCDS